MIRRKEAGWPPGRRTEETRRERENGQEDINGSMYLETLESFMVQAEDLYRANPTRWVLTSTDARPGAPTLSLALRFARSPGVVTR